MEPTDADIALGEIFKRDAALARRIGKPPRYPAETSKKLPEVKKAEEELRKSFYDDPSKYPEKKAALKEAEAELKRRLNEEGIAGVYKGGGEADKPPLFKLGRPSPVNLSPNAIRILDEASVEYDKSNIPGYDKKMEEAAAVLKEDLKEKGIAGVYAPAKVAPLKGGVTRRNTTTGGDIVTSLLTIRNQVKLYHWQTGSFARHKATDDLTAALDLSIDNFVEVYMGRYGRPKVSKTIKLSNYTEAEAQRFVSKQRKFLSEVLPRKIKKSDTDLLNVRDEILAELNKVLYLFTLA